MRIFPVVLLIILAVACAGVPTPTHLSTATPHPMIQALQLAAEIEQKLGQVAHEAYLRELTGTLDTYDEELNLAYCARLRELPLVTITVNGRQYANMPSEEIGALNLEMLHKGYSVKGLGRAVAEKCPDQREKAPSPPSGPTPTMAATPTLSPAQTPLGSPTPTPTDEERVSTLRADVTLEVGERLFRSVRISRLEGGALPGRTIEVIWVLADASSKAAVQNFTRLQMVNILNDIYNSGIAYDVVHLRALGTLRDGARSEEVTMVYVSYPRWAVDAMFDGRMGRLDMVGNIYKFSSGVYVHPVFQE